jgi:hypothetical protein
MLYHQESECCMGISNMSKRPLRRNSEFVLSCCEKARNRTPEELSWEMLEDWKMSSEGED